MKAHNITSVAKDPATDLALDTIRIGKQAIVFVNTKRSAEATAEKIAQKHRVSTQGKQLAQEVLNAVSSPTKQCRRLAYCIERETAFHHSGLTSKQRGLIEDAFRAGKIHVIAATPSLAMGVDTPAFRSIIRDYKRFSGAGMTDIPILEYLQQAGRAGRPDYGDDYGEAILLAKSQAEAEMLTEKYLFGEPEAIYSKVSAQPVLRTYTLSLIASEFVKTTQELQDFFAETFFAHQYGDAAAITKKLSETLHQLREWEFLEKPGIDDFASAADLREDALVATRLGRRVSELYIDPLSAHKLLTGLTKSKATLFAYLHLICSTQEMRPLVRVKPDDYEVLEEYLQKKQLLIPEPSLYDTEYELYLEAAKTARLLADWADERSEEYLLETYNARPGEVRARVHIADWLLYAGAELSRIVKRHQHIAELQKARTRLAYGAREELLPLLRLKNIGRVRARKLHRNGVRTAGDVKKVETQKLSSLLGPTIAKDLKKQVGIDVDEQALSPTKRTGQLSLDAKRFQ